MNSYVIDATALAQDLIRCPSITPRDAGALDVLQKTLETLGFSCHRQKFQEVDNLYARRGTTGKNLCYAGHTDVVPVNKPELWSCDPFAAIIREDKLYGRGAVDMKGGIACYIAALSQMQAPDGSLSFLITGDEEGIAENGTIKMLELLKDKGEIIDACLVGEPTSVNTIGDTVKVGRRGSMNVDVKVMGRSGHSAYPHLADNPIPRLVTYLHQIMQTPLDQGTELFEPTNCQIVSIDVGNEAYNVIPEVIQARLNIRFNSLHTRQSITQWLESQVLGNMTISTWGNAEAFYCPDESLIQCAVKAITSITGQNPSLSTNGGTSDARFIKNVCPVIELGLKNETAHKVDEHVDLKDMTQLVMIYKAFINQYFQ